MAKKLNKITKEAILRGVNSIPLNSLIGFINKGEFKIDDYVENDLNPEKIEEIQQTLTKIKKDIKTTKEAIVKADDIYNQINNDEMIIQVIQEHLSNGHVTKEGLIENCNEIDENILNKIIKYTAPSISSENNKDPLIFGTDVFFYGKSQSGKTCVLASLFSYANKKGVLIDNYKASIKGHHYKDIIVKELENGILPRRTSATKDAVTYISTKLKVNENDHPLNFVEMSGEFFSRAVTEFEGLETSIDAHGYLSNKNKKIFFFVIDYQMHQDGEVAKGKTQEREFNAGLDLLEDYEDALKNTYCIYVVVNKSDKFPPHVVDRNEYAKEYFIENFASVYTNLQDKKEKYNIKLRILHYSIGDFIFNNSYLQTLNYECPKRVINSISEYTSKDRKSGYFEKLFKDND